MTGLWEGWDWNWQASWWGREWNKLARRQTREGRMMLVNVKCFWSREVPVGQAAHESGGGGVPGDQDPIS